jgi:hypothetical protein
MENKKPDCVIKEITGEDVLRYFHWIKEINYSDITPVQCLAKCLSGEYKVYIGLNNEEVVGIVIYKVVNPTFVFVVALYGKNQVTKFRDMLYDKLKKQGVTLVRSSTTRAEESYGRLMQMERLWTVYERVL